MHKIIEGMADKSYGIHVAELAGLPKSVIQRAQHILVNLEQNHGQNMTVDVKTALPNLEDHPMANIIDDIEVDDLSPKEALEILYKLKKML